MQFHTDFMEIEVRYPDTIMKASIFHLLAYIALKQQRRLL